MYVLSSESISSLATPAAVKYARLFLMHALLISFETASIKARTCSGIGGAVASAPVDIVVLDEPNVALVKRY